MPAVDLRACLSWPPGLRGRPVTTADEVFLQHVHACVHARDLMMSGLAPSVLKPLVQMQFEAQRQHYLRHHPGAQAWLIALDDGTAVAQMWLHLDGSSLRLMDIAVLPAYRGQGIGRRCLRVLTDLADAHGFDMHLHVVADNPVRQWYDRLGFVPTERHGLHQAMIRIAVDQESPYEQA